MEHGNMYHRNIVNHLPVDKI